jgi:glutamine---fructose-6-phosphate transaminase (isomerizing)
MCGIFGIVVKEHSGYSPAFIKKALKGVAEISIARGQDSSGLVFKNNATSGFNLVKGDIPVTRLLKNEQYLEMLNESVALYQNGQTFQAMGHARLVTNGSQLKDINNQPVVKSGAIAVHNGIIVNNEKLWQENPDLERHYDIDTEVLLSLVKKKLNKLSLPDAISEAMNEIEGTASCVMFFDDRHELALFTNNGSLYYILEKDLLVIASEAYFLKKAMKQLMPSAKINHLAAFEGIVLNTRTFEKQNFKQKEPTETRHISDLHARYSIKPLNLKGDFDREVVIDPMEFIVKSKEHALYQLLENNVASIDRLKRCTKCILPETFPFIEFDAQGECSYCRNYKPQKQIQSFDRLKELVAPYKRNDGRSDCIVPFSGGRDSTYSLHIVKKELGLNPIAFTYDWGMVTDLARRNIARVCGKLGVENIIVSADINWKRENIRKNVSAWLKNPELGMIPLFMAGDKYFFYYCNQVKKQTGIDLNIWGINNLENTDFKTGFAGLSPQADKKRIYSLSLQKQLKLFGYVARNVIQSPGYLNQSVIDSLGSFAVRYLAPKKDYFHLFDYYKWDENELESIIQSEYHWEKAIDTDSTWRIGDGTASFYNYIYYTVAGFTENDTFRSNQIREGMITREQALAKLNRENEARYETLRWYLEIIGLDFSEVIQVINRIPKLYPLIK